MNEFVPDIEVGFPLEVCTGNLGDDHSIEFRLGYLMQTEQIVLMSVAMVEGASFLPRYDGVYDLRFGIRLQYIDRPWNVTAMDYHQATKRRYIHPNNREVVRSLTARAIQGLVAAIQPPEVTMSTFDAELPPIALVKYRVIEECLQRMGYRTADAYRSEDGKDRWHFVVAT